MARLRDKLLAHGEQWDQLWSGLQSPGTSMTLLFTGPAGVGKVFAARALAQAMLCERQTDGCGQCGSCLRVEAGHHESFLEIRAEGTQIKIDQAAEVARFLHLARIGRSRVILIEGAQSLNPQAANSLLKILEEPPEATIIILTAPSPSSVLPTLRSRSRSMLFRRLTIEELKQLQSAPDWALRAARGSVEKLREMMEPAAQESRGAAAHALEGLLSRPDFLFEPSWREFVREKGQFPRILNFWTSFVRDGLVLHAKGAEFVANPDQKQLLSLLEKQPRPLLEFLADRCMALEAETAFNRDPQLAVEELTIHIRNARGA